MKYVYPAAENPLGGFEWWLAPCGNQNLVPDEVKNAFNILSNVADGVGSFKKPSNIKQGSGKIGDATNPKKN
jgi:hypothetical protein